MHRYIPRCGSFRRCIALVCCLVTLLSLTGCYRRSRTSSDAEQTAAVTTAHKTTTPTTLPQSPRKPGVRQVAFSSFAFTVAVLYEDGTVRVALPESGDSLSSDQLAQLKAVSQWKDIVEIWNHTGFIFGLKKDGTLVSTDPALNSEISRLRNVVSISYNEPDPYLYVLHEDGTVSALPQGASERTDIANQWTDVIQLVPYLYYGMFAIHHDGTASDCIDFIDDNLISQVYSCRELFALEDRLVILKRDGRVDVFPIPNEYVDYEEIPNEALSLYGVDYAYRVQGPGKSWICGLDSGGDLMVSGGEEWYNAEYAPFMNTNPIRLSDYEDLAALAITAQLVPVTEIAALRKDGTVVTLNDSLNPWLADWENVVKLGWTYSNFESTLRLYGLKEDGTVSLLEADPNTGSISVQHRYNNLVLEDFAISPADNGIFLGFFADGTIFAEGDNLNYINPQDLEY